MISCCLSEVIIVSAQADTTQIERIHLLHIRVEVRHLLHVLGDDVAAQVLQLLSHLWHITLMARVTDTIEIDVTARQCSVDRKSVV